MQFERGTPEEQKVALGKPSPQSGHLYRGPSGQVQRPRGKTFGRLCSINRDRKPVCRETYPPHKPDAAFTSRDRTGKAHHTPRTHSQSGGSRNHSLGRARHGFSACSH